MLFTDIEGSTRMVQELGPSYGDVLSDQRRIMRRTIAAYGGHEMGTEGDSFFVVFASATKALAAAVDAQRALGRHEWPASATVRVRMGVHVGAPERHEEGYVGVDLNRAARVASTAHGGQIVVSAELREVTAEAPIEGLAFVDLARHRLKDLADPEHLFRVRAEGIVDVTTPVKSLGAPSNLPSARAAVIGREEAIDQVVAALQQGGRRLVTLTGPGGVGKTTTALQVARRLAGGELDGVYFVALEQARDADDAWAALAGAVGIPTGDAGPAEVVATLAARHALLVLDNLEQLPPAGDVIGELLDHTEVSVLATSRGPLGLRGEQELPLATLERTVACALFEREAQRGRPSFAVDAGNEPVVTEICRRLDGLPLAIELAAARIRLLSPQQLLDSLAAQLWLQSTDRDRPDRQRTLAGAIGWSFDLLEEADQQAFVALAVFEDGADLEAVEAVLGGSAGGVDVFDVVSSLARVGLLTLVDGPDGGVRAAMLTAVREFSRSRFDELASVEAEELARRHAAHFARLAEEAEHHLRGPRHLLWADRLHAEQRNLSAAFLWANGLAGDDRSYALRIASALGWFWYAHGRADEGRAWLQRAVEGDDADDGVSPAVRARVAHALGVLQQQQGDNEEAVRNFERALALWRAIGNDDGLARELNSLGVARWSMSEPDAAAVLLEESVAVARRADNPARLASALSNLGMVALSRDAVDESVQRFEEAMRIDEQLDDRWGVACGRANLGAALIRRGEVARAHAMLVDVLPAAVDFDDPDLLASTVEGIALAAATVGRSRHAVVLLAAGDAMRAAAGIPRAPFDEAYLERGLGPARAALSADDLDAARMEGGQLAGAELVEVARRPID